MPTNPNGLRGLARDTAATGYYIMSWFGFLVGLVLVCVGGVKALSAAGSDEALGVALGNGVLGVVFALLAWLNRWLAGGVLLLRKGVVAAAIVCSTAWGLLLLLSPMPDPSLNTSVTLRTLGVINLLGAALLVWLLFSTRKAGGDEA